MSEWPRSLSKALVAVQELLTQGAEIQAVCSNGWSHLHGAAFAGRCETVKFLLEKGITVDAKNKLGQTPLHLAAAAGHTTVVEHLLSVGADKTATTRSGSTGFVDTRFSPARAELVLLSCSTFQHCTCHSAISCHSGLHRQA